MAKKEIINIIIEFIQSLKKNGVTIDRVFLYGSYARGISKDGSDIDIAVISPDFGKDRYEEGKLLRQLAWRIDTRLEPVPISSESFLNDDWIPLIHEIKTNGIPIEVAV